MATASHVSEVQTLADELRGRYLSFKLEDSYFGIELHHVLEIIGVQPITRVPKLPGYIKGVTNLRGRILPVIDVRLKFGKEESVYDSKTCVIIVTINDMQVGLIVDRVADVVSVEPEKLAPPPDTGSDVTGKFLSSIAQTDERLILNIDCEKFFDGDLRTAKESH